MYSVMLLTSTLSLGRSLHAHWRNRNTSKSLQTGTAENTEFEGEHLLRSAETGDRNLSGNEAVVLEADGNSRVRSENGQFSRSASPAIEHHRVVNRSDETEDARFASEANDSRTIDQSVSSEDSQRSDKQISIPTTRKFIAIFFLMYSTMHGVVFM